MADLVCVAPARVREIWPHVRTTLLAAVKVTNLSHTQDIEDAILSGRSLLWLVWDGRLIKAAVSTELMATDTDKFCVLTACGGKDMRDWLMLLGKIEEYAKAEGCKALRIYGRRGWKRVLEDYRETAIVIEKDL
jgi:hypothetical protein